MLGRCWVDFGQILGRFGSIFGLGRVLGGLGVALGGQDRFLTDLGVDFEARLGAQHRPKSIENRCQEAFKFCIGFWIDF